MQCALHYFSLSNARRFYWSREDRWRYIYILFHILGNLIGPAVSSIIEGRGLDSIIKLPTGCGEQTMLKLAPNVFVLNYLRSTKQVTQQIEQTAFNFIRSGKSIAAAREQLG